MENMLNYQVNVKDVKREKNATYVMCKYLWHIEQSPFTPPSSFLSSKSWSFATDCSYCSTMLRGLWIFKQAPKKAKGGS